MVLCCYSHVLLWPLKGHSVVGVFTLRLDIADSASDVGQAIGMNCPTIDGGTQILSCRSIRLKLVQKLGKEQSTGLR